MDRRDFLRVGAGWIVVVNGTTLLVSGCGGGGDGGNSGNSFTSTVDQGHAHTFTIPDSALDDPPPAGFQDSTSTVSGHAHTVSLTQSQLQQIQGGTAVTVTSSTVSAHTHDFTFQVATFAQREAARRAGLAIG